MIKIENTENMTGISIQGDWDDLDELVEAFYEMTSSETIEKYKDYSMLAMRVLGLCYDVRHAKQGSREIVLEDNNMDDEKMKWHSTVTPKKNVYFKCNYLYPEMFLVTLILNEFVKIRIQDLIKKKYYFYSVFDKNVIWDETIATIRAFQAEFARCVRETLTDASYRRWLNLMNADHINIRNIKPHYVDILNIRHIEMSKEKRIKSLTSIARKITGYRTEEEHREIEEAVRRGAAEYNCSEADIRIEGDEYPGEIEW